MLKFINKNDTLNTPFTTTKDRHLSNNLNEDLILFEQGTEVAIEFIDYGDGSTSQPFINSSCSLANENQSANLATYREGKKISGLFYPDEDPQNLDLTYKRIVYNQIQGMFYNNYRDPSKMWGMEEIDFDKSQAKKFLTDKFVIFTISPKIMGEKVIPKTVLFIDNSSDNEYSIKDDGNTNLFIGKNVFSREQELGHFVNSFATGSDGTCNFYFDIGNNPDTPILSGSLITSSIVPSGSLSWSMVSNPSGYVLERSASNSSSFTTLAFTGPSTVTFIDNTVSSSLTYLYRVYAYNSFGSSSYSNIVVLALIPPTIVVQPVDITSNLTVNVSFSVTATGSLPLFYRWQFNGIDLNDSPHIVGSLTNTLNINSVSSSDAGGYRAFVSNSFGSVYSNTASLSVTTASIITDYYFVKNSFATLSGKTIPAAKGFIVPIYISGSVYLYGGYNGSVWTNTIYTSSLNDPFTIGDSGKTLPSAVLLSNLRIINNNIYSFGGDGSFVTSSIFTASVADPTTWMYAGDMPIKISGHYIFPVGNKLYCVFGQDETGQYISSSFTASLSNPTVWGNSNITTSVISFNNVAQGIIGGNTIYVYGGTTIPGGFNNQNQSVFTASTSSPLNWGIGAPSPTQTYYVSQDTLLSIGTLVYKIAGSSGASTISNIFAYSSSFPMDEMSYGNMSQLNTAGTAIIVSYSGSYKIVMYGGFDDIVYHNRIYSCSIFSFITASNNVVDYSSSNQSWKVLPAILM